MIFDKLKNKKLYFKKKIFDDIFQQLKEYTIETLDGTYKNHKDFYFKVMTYDTKFQPSVIESHKREVDIQIVLFGNENIRIFDIDDVEITEPYNEEIDCQFYKPKNDHSIEVSLKPGYMAVFFPQDIHFPQFVVNGRVEKLKKIVIKIDEKLFS